jgi:PIN domain nuclease of toxin-antitoxin system
MMVLDTHAWLWWATGSKKLPTRVRRRIERSPRLGVCVISCWEVAMLVARGRVRLDRPPRAWVHEALGLPNVAVLTLDHDTAVEAALLAPFGGDPGDCLIIASARAIGAPLVTADAAIAESGLVDVIW